tara:strand:+ start:648 stop:1253 length:606 start_codon:yes stop_codon:yes gene_type:complete
MRKLTDKEVKETEILSKRIMPKTDFLKVVEHDKLYYNTLNQALEMNIIKQDILGKKCQLIIAKQKREEIVENIDMLCEWSETQVKVLDMKGKLSIQRKLIDDKEIHYKNVFLPQFERESKEASKNFKSTMAKAKEILSKNEKGMESICDKINYELAWWNKCTAEKKKNEEYIVQIYKPLKRLQSAYDKKVKELEDEAKFKM